MNVLLWKRAIFTHLTAGQDIRCSRWTFGPLTHSTVYRVVTFNLPTKAFFVWFGAALFSIFIFTVFHVVLAALFMHNTLFVIHFVQHTVFTFLVR